MAKSYPKSSEETTNEIIDFKGSLGFGEAHPLDSATGTEVLEAVNLEVSTQTKGHDVVPR
jgi:hypothetical protein